MRINLTHDGAGNGAAAPARAQTRSTSRRRPRPGTQVPNTEHNRAGPNTAKRAQQLARHTGREGTARGWKRGGRRRKLEGQEERQQRSARRVSSQYAKPGVGGWVNWRPRSEQDARGRLKMWFPFRSHHFRRLPAFKTPDSDFSKSGKTTYPHSTPHSLLLS